MRGLAFFDTNILLYADDASAPEVLQEYFAAATKKLGVDAEIAQRKVELPAAAGWCAWKRAMWLPASNCTA